MSKYILTSDQTKKVNKAINYVKKFKGMKYKYFANDKKWPEKDEAPFWIQNAKPPPFSKVYKDGANCAGLMNLVRRFMGLDIPGDAKYAGGTHDWFSYLKKRKILEKINHNKVYPPGTLLLQNYNPKDQGHVACTIDSSKKGILDSKMIHNINGEGTVITQLKYYPRYDRFTHICLPQNWLLKN
jgi:hypothetical protein